MNPYAYKNISMEDKIRDIYLSKMFVHDQFMINDSLLKCELIDPVLTLTQELERSIFTIKGYLWKDDKDEIVEVKYPRDWWQHFKLRWFPIWLKKRYPVIFTVETIKVSCVYPD